MDKIDLMKQIGNRVRHHRLDKKISQSELARMVDCNDSAITRIESGKRMMSISMLLAISEALNISVAVLLHSPSESTCLDNITQILSNQSESSLIRLERVLRVCITEYGEHTDI